MDPDFSAKVLLRSFSRHSLLDAGPMRKVGVSYSESES
jgi:hypothetical protein